MVLCETRLCLPSIDRCSSLFAVCLQCVLICPLLLLPLMNTSGWLGRSGRVGVSARVWAGASARPAGWPAEAAAAASSGARRELRRACCRGPRRQQPRAGRGAGRGSEGRNGMEGTGDRGEEARPETGEEARQETGGRSETGDKGRSETGGQGEEARSTGDRLVQVEGRGRTRGSNEGDWRVGDRGGRQGRGRKIA